ncbi:acyl-CoA mutase large subunit family protein [Ferroplasma acidiphilum]|jgi:methylmalonyl-CoA mutase N-terminal domain/subunit|uniref:Methylmalonyl-CoA mutase n=1 Tax=Ferroplasma acidiphilum TaxID=74969 RepID=A0A1V0N2A3_9ARCH|nr:methylmalonyl-CoA mutase family protein [Ferroplasma acidiphilum]ARD84224.1 methylmalonyl-CoA mutase large subunit [Ferroplasma acidiphilum]MCL4349342.1 methylmalonyl-CoA mutase family protein [Candidatus Thermoplasmatota archaeon]NOL60050.1 methylmalonyl-CoA mutase [Ferroplasma acidiphilum]WMT53131.1 MAG: methylmalonyl-CoA mutase family protein [Ferroplasma acidiphilum]
MENFWDLKIKEIKGSFKEDKNYEEWKKTILEPWNKKTGYRDKIRTNSSSMPVKELYTRGDLPDNIDSILGNPGEYPFTRGVYPNMYRGRNWTMRMFSGFGTPDDTNKRLKYLIENGETGLSIAFDMPTLYGFDCDNKRAEGEVGKCGVNVSSLHDMERIFDGIDLSKVSTSMTINAPAAILTAMYFVLAEEKGIPLEKIAGTVQADILKEYIAQKEWMYPPEAHLRLIRDMLTYSTEHVPKWNYISVSGYHIREAGSSAVQELAFTLADGFYYIEMGMNAGLNVDDFAPRMSFFFNSSINFFEEIAKFRAARRIWATVLKEKYHAKNPRSMELKFHTQTSGYTLTWQQPLNNIVRTTIEAMAAVLGGTQSLHTNSYDEAWALPTDDAVKVALRTQQIIAEETGIADVIDPLGGSYYLERLTCEMEIEAYKYFSEIEKMGGILDAVKSGYIQKEIADTSYKKQLKIENEDDIIVGVNRYVDKDEKPINTLKITDIAENGQINSLKNIKSKRDESKVAESLEKLKNAMEDESVNLMPYIMDCVRNYCTLEEISNIGRDIFGEWKEPKIY